MLGTTETRHISQHRCSATQALRDPYVILPTHITISRRLTVVASSSEHRQMFSGFSQRDSGKKAGGLYDLKSQKYKIFFYFLVCIKRTVDVKMYMIQFNC